MFWYGWILSRHPSRIDNLLTANSVVWTCCLIKCYKMLLEAYSIHLELDVPRWGKRLHIGGKKHGCSEILRLSYVLCVLYHQWSGELETYDGNFFGWKLMQQKETIYPKRKKDTYALKLGRANWILHLFLYGFLSWHNKNYSALVGRLSVGLVPEVRRSLHIGVKIRISASCMHLFPLFDFNLTTSHPAQGTLSLSFMHLKLAASKNAERNTKSMY